MTYTTEPGISGKRLRYTDLNLFALPWFQTPSPNFSFFEKDSRVRIRVSILLFKFIEFNPLSKANAILDEFNIPIVVF